MIVVFRPDTSYRPHPLADVGEYASRRTALAAAVDATIFMLAAPAIDRELIQVLDDVRALTAPPWMVVYTKLTEENAGALAQVKVDHVVWDHQEEGVLLDLFHKRLRGSGEIRLLLRAIERSDADLPAQLRNALRIALTAYPPVRTVKRWANLTGCTPRNLQLLWNRHLGSILLPHEFIRAVASARATRGELNRAAATTLARVCTAIASVLSSKRV